MNILVEGSRPFRLDRRVDDLAYPAGDVELLDDQRRASRPRPPAAAARRAYADLVEQVTDARPSEADLAELDAYGMASTIAFDAADKQGMLELRAEDDRLRHLGSRSARTALDALRGARVRRPSGRAPTAGRTADGARHASSSAR